MLSQEVINDPFGNGYEYLGTVLIVDMPRFGKDSVVKTYQNLFNGTNVQVHSSGHYRLRAAPNREKPFPEYGAWLK